MSAKMIRIDVMPNFSNDKSDHGTRESMDFLAWYNCKGAKSKSKPQGT